MVPDWPGEVLGSGLDRPVPLYEAVTDDRGYFEFPELPAGEYMLTIVAEGFAEFRDTVLLPPGVEIRRNFYLRPLNLAPALLEGFVREASPASTVGRPIPGAEVTLIMMHVRNGTHYILPGFYRAYTDQEGYYRIEGIQPTAYHVSVSAAGFEPFYGQIELASGDARREDFLLRPALPRPGRVCGVVSSYLGPLAGARVSIPIAGLVLSAETDPQGRYCISNVPAGLRHVVAKKDGYSTEEREVLVPSGGEAVADFFLHPENLPASFSGVVFGATDPAGPAPQPVPGARVELYVVYPPTFAPQFYVTFTNEAGEFRIDGIMAPSICRLTISAVGCNSFVVEEIPFEPGDQIYREFVLRCPAVQTGRMEGRVAADIPGWVGPLLPPIEGAVVQLRPIPLPTGAPELPPPMYEAVTDATGYYVIRGIQPAYYNVMVMAEGFQSADDLALIEAGDTLIRNYALKPLPAGNGSISGRVIVNTTNRGYPLDQNLDQTVTGMKAAVGIVRDGGHIIMAGACEDGIPDHGRYLELLVEAGSPQGFLDMMAQPGFGEQDQWQVQIQALIQLKAEVHVYSDGLSDEQIRSALFTPCSNIEETVKRLAAEIGPDARICAMPEGPQTIAYLR